MSIKSKIPWRDRSGASWIIAFFIARTKIAEHILARLHGIALLAHTRLRVHGPLTCREPLRQLLANIATLLLVEQLRLQGLLLHLLGNPTHFDAVKGHAHFDAPLQTARFTAVSRSRSYFAVLAKETLVVDVSLDIPLEKTLKKIQFSNSLR